jgi:hypothetical protein
VLHAKGLQGAVFGGGGEGEVAGVTQHLLVFDEGVDQIFVIFNTGFVGFTG